MFHNDDLYADTIEETYENIKPVLKGVVHSFRSRHECSWEPEDMLSITRVRFVKTYHSWDPEQSTYGTYLRMVCYYALLDESRKRARKTTKYNISLDAILEIGDIPSLQDTTQYNVPLLECLDDLSADASLVVSILLEDFKYHRTNHDTSKGCTWARLREELKQIMNADFGWDRKHINNTFKEIGTAIAC